MRKMKKIFLMMLLVLLTVSFVGCSDDASQEDGEKVEETKTKILIDK